MEIVKAGKNQDPVNTQSKAFNLIPSMSTSFSYSQADSPSF